jgi:hypothetical protein
LLSAGACYHFDSGDFFQLLVQRFGVPDLIEEENKGFNCLHVVSVSAANLKPNSVVGNLRRIHYQIWWW